MTTYVLDVKEDPETGDLILEFPDSLLENTGWKVGDTLEWVDNKDGSWTLRSYKEHDETYYDTDRNK